MRFRCGVGRCHPAGGARVYAFPGRGDLAIVKRGGERTAYMQMLEG